MKGQSGKDNDGADSIRLVSEDVQLGIYRFEYDLLHTCLSAPGKTRPSKYEPRPKVVRLTRLGADGPMSRYLTEPNAAGIPSYPAASAHRPSSSGDL
jgi:hypothetical protein